MLENIERAVSADGAHCRERLFALGFSESIVAAQRSCREMWGLETGAHFYTGLRELPIREFLIIRVPYFGVIIRILLL